MYPPQPMSLADLGMKIDDGLAKESELWFVSIS